jgi:cell wall-associated NlpC family hydrolase
VSGAPTRTLAQALALGSLAACGPGIPTAVPAPAPEAGPTVELHGDRKPGAEYPETPAPTLGPGLSLSEAELLGADIVVTAREAMGRPYRLGGKGDDGRGFDCSGLIQFAYAEHGLALPRISADQALAGVGLPREVEQLLPGDLLTFSRNPGGKQVTHVGMYVGDGRFIHSSSSRGVTESALTQDDPEGRWWLKRWLGARRVLGHQLP